MLTTEKLGNRLTFVIIIGLFAIAGFYVSNSYFLSKNQLEKSVLKKLKAIATTTALQIDGDLHQLITERYTEKDQIKNPLTDSLTAPVFELLKAVKHKNHLNTDIYTLFLNQQKGNDKVFMGIISGETQYFKHTYFSHPDELLLFFDEGATLPIYTDNHGMWLSAFAPIKNSKDETVAVVQVDERFDEFLSNLRAVALKNALISLFIIILVSVVMLYLINKIVKVDRQKTEKLKQAYRIVEEQNKNISDSINYAQRIQNSIVAKESELQLYFPKSFMYYNAKDVVSGDFPWLLKKGNIIYVAVVDCTGHGVPGAMLSFIGHFLLNEINSHSNNLSPNQILDCLHDGVVKTLKQDDENCGSHDGMDLALCKIDLNTNILEYAGAHRPLFVSQNGKLQEIKGTRKSIGGTQYKKLNRTFENEVIQLKEGDSFYFYSDGFVDQMGGDDGLEKLGSKRVREMMNELKHDDITKVSEKLISTFEAWMGTTQQLDDVLLIGIQV